MSSILHAIQECLEQLSLQERRVATYVLQSPSTVKELGIKEIAYLCEVSPATVTRFCKSMYFRGYPDFKMKLASELAHQPVHNTYQDIIAGNDLHTMITAIEANHVTSITDTTRLLDITNVQKVIDLLRTARLIDLYGVATSSIVAQDLYQKLVRIGKPCTAFADVHMQLTSASALRQGDVAIAISYSGETKETIAALRCAKESGAFTVAITHYGSSTLASLADITLFSSSLEEGIRRGDMASRIAQLHIVDILFMGMVSSGFEEYVPRLEKSYQNIRKYGGM